MGKTLFWVVAFLGGLLVTRVLAQLAAKKMHNDSLPKQASAKQRVEAEVMVQCAHCGVHLPESEAITKAGVIFCSQAHASLGARPQR
jgi:uncharacterized protein